MDVLPQQESRSCRLVTAADLSWLMSLAYRRYGPYDPGKMLRFLLGALENPDGLLLRGEQAFLVAGITSPIWENNLECHVMALCAASGAHWQTIPLLRRSVDWARAKGCTKWWIASETKNDIGALAKRVGAYPMWPRYRMDL